MLCLSFSSKSKATNVFPKLILISKAPVTLLKRDPNTGVFL